MIASKSVALRCVGAACLTVGLVGEHRSAAQGIDCSKSSNPVQMTICADADLKALDQKMVSLYREATKRATPAQQKELAAQQQGWIVTRNACFNEKDLKMCVAEAYGQRNEVLSSFASAPSPAQTTKYVCEDKSTLAIQPIPGAKDQARVSHGTSTWTLLHVPTGSGAKYADKDVSVWNKGTEVLFEQGGKSLKCTAAK